MGRGILPCSPPVPPRVQAADNKTKIGSSKTGFYSTAREWRSEAHALKAPSPQRKEGGGLLRSKRQASLPIRNWGEGQKVAGTAGHVQSLRRLRPRAPVTRSSFPTIYDPMNYSPPGSSVHGASQARRLPFPAPGVLLDPPRY